MISVAEFESAEFDVSEFNHEAHVYVAWSLLRDCTLTDAIARYTCALRKITERIGQPGKYHETVSWFFLIKIAERKTGAAEDDWNEFKRRNPDILEHAGELIGKYYSAQLLQSETARKLFVLPDIGESLQQAH
jgi:hypothetical protein